MRVVTDLNSKCVLTDLSGLRSMSSPRSNRFTMSYLHSSSLERTLFEKFVLIAHAMHFAPLAKGKNQWEIREAVTAFGRKFAVWRGPRSPGGDRGDLCISAVGYVFKHREAAEAEIKRLAELGEREDALPLYAVSSWSISGAVESVLAQIYGENDHGAKRLR